MVGCETRLECLLNNNKNSDFIAPLTSFDWNEVDPNLLGELADIKEVSRPSFEQYKAEILGLRFRKSKPLL